MTALKTLTDVLQIVLQAFPDGIVLRVQGLLQAFAQQIAGMDLKEAQRNVMTQIKIQAMGVIILAS